MKVCIGPYKDEGERKERVSIHEYDTWNMDNTLALIILPMLRQLKEQKHGSPMVDQEDVPKNLRTTYPAMYGDQLDLFNTYDELGDLENDLLHARWDWALNEMIWAFEQYEKDDFEEEFWSENPEIDWDAPGDKVKFSKHGVCDWEGLKAHGERMVNGFKLFGKYYMSLWT